MKTEALAGKTAVITGAASGLGAAIAAELAETGIQVLLADVNRARLDEVADEIEGARAVQLDVADSDAIAAAWERFDKLGEIDILINNAGVDHTMPIPDLSVPQIDHVLDVNLRGPFLMAREAMSRWQQRGSGEIVNICSTAAKRTWPNAAAYHASKWGLLGLSHAMHVEARDYGVRVTAVVCGGMRTPFILERFPDTPLENLQEPANVASAIRSVLTLPKETVIPELTVLPMTETSWP